MKRRSKLFLLSIGILFLTGCTGRELEDRNFPLAMEINYVDGEFQVEYGLPNLSKETGQEKNGDETKTKEEKNVDRERTGGATLKEACDHFQEDTEKYMDISHMKGVILDMGVVENPDTLKEALSYLENNPGFARTMQVFVYARESENSLIKETEGTVESLGLYLENIMENHPKRLAVEPVLLGDILDFWHNKKEEIQVPLIKVRNEKPVAAENYKLNRMF